MTTTETEEPEVQEPQAAGPAAGRADIDMDAEIQPAPDSPEGQAQAAAEEAPAGDESDEAILGKYETPEDLQKAYLELYRKQRNGEPEPPEGAAGPEPEEPGGLEIGDPDPDPAPEGPAHAEQFQAAANEFAETGELTEETRSKLEELIPGEYIDAFIRGQEMLSQDWDSQIMSAAGGAEGYAEMVNSDWAKNLPEEQKAAFNAAVKGKDLNAAQLAVKGLFADFKAAGGRPNEHSVEGRTTATGPKPFTSTEEMLAAMDHPEYQKGTGEYYDKVQARIAVSPRGAL